MTFANERGALAAAYLVSTIMLLWVGIANGFPTVFSDTGTYLRIGTELYLPPDRPPTYGLAILPFYTLFGLWSVAIAQSLFTVWVIDRTMRVVTGRHSPVTLAVTVAALAALTSLPWLVPQILPDLFAGLVMLLGYVLIFGWAGLARWERWLLPLLLTLLIAFHLSFVPILGGVTVAAALLGWRMTRSIRPLIGAAIIITAVAVVMLGVSTINLLVQGQFKASTSSSTFMLTRFLDGRVAQPTIAEACVTEKLLLCRLRTVLDPAQTEPGAAYMWSAHPELTAAEAKQLPREEAMIVSRTMRDHPGSVAQMAIAGFGRQLLLAEAGDGMIAYPPDTQVHQQIVRHFPQQSAAWLASRQQRGALPALLVTPDRAIGLIAGLLTIVVLALAVSRRDPRLAGLALVTILTLILNALFCSFLSGIFERFQARIMWMPLFTLAAALACWSQPRPANDT